jgi:hypothetical protein
MSSHIEKSKARPSAFDERGRAALDLAGWEDMDIFAH